MNWHVKVFKGRKEEIEQTAVPFVEAVIEKLIATGFTKRRVLHKDLRTSGEVSYFISPEVSAVVQDVLTRFSAEECAEIPSMDVLTEIQY